MASRRNIPPLHDRHIIPALEMTRHGLLPAASHSVEPPTRVLLEKKFAAQAAEVEQLSEDNHKLACSHIALRQDLVAANQEVDKLREHIRSIQTEGDIQIRILLDKIGKMEANIRNGDNINKELQEARVEAQSLVEAKLELTAQIQRATNESDSVRADVKKLPQMHSELDSLRQEHNRLRKVFEHEKGLNIEKVEQMKIMEKDLIRMVEEVERLRTEVLNAEKRTSAPIAYSTPHINSDYMYPPTFHGNGGLENFSRPFPPLVGVVGGANPFASGGYAHLPPVVNGPVISSTGVPGWRGTFGPSHIPK
ncbi:protein FLX-like 4 [Dorcoceras hygrometricum]|nr:protein FLX-like 4 [Dorcoceras hygrometricum]